MTPQRPRPESEAALKPYVESASAATKQFDFVTALEQLHSARSVAEALDPPDPLAIAEVLQGMVSIGILGTRVRSLRTVPSSLTDIAAKDIEAWRARARQLITESVGADSPAMAAHLAAEAALLHFGERSSEAGPMLTRALDILNRHPEDGAPYLSSVLTQMALVQMQTGQTGEAEATLKRALEIAASPASTALPVTLAGIGGGQSTEARMAASLNMLGMLYTQEGRFKEAESVARQALELDEYGEGAERHLRSTYNVLGMALRHQWRIREGWRYYRRYMAMDWQQSPAIDWSLRWPMSAASVLTFVIAPRMHAPEDK